MAEKGAKQFQVPKGKASATKSSAKKGKNTPSKGKDGNVSKGRTVVFDNSSDSDGSPRFNTNVSGKSKGDWGKGGKGGKAGTPAGQSNALKVPETPKFEIVLPDNARCLMDCEAEVLLRGIHEQLAILSEDPKIKVPGSFDKGLQYAKSGCYYTSSLSARKLLQKLKRNNVSDGEICLVGNISPENTDELFALMPSIKEKETKTGIALESVLLDLTKLKSSQ